MVAQNEVLRYYLAREKVIRLEMVLRPHPAMPGLEPARSDEPTDEELVARIARGSEESLAAMYDRHVGAIFGSALRLLAERTDAEEVVQETFLALWNRAEQFDAGRGSARTWLLSIARNRSIDRARARSARLRPLAFSSVVAADDEGDAETEAWLLGSAEPIAAGAAPELPEDVLVGIETGDDVRAALASLDPVERDVIVLAYREQLSQSEIAERLKWPLGTVKTRTRRALRNLRSALERVSPDEVAVPSRSGEAECCA